MHKRIAMLVILAILAIGIVACGNSESTTTPTVEPVAVGAAASSTDTEAVAEEQADSAIADDTATGIGLSYPIVDTNQGLCYNNSEIIDCPAEGDSFYGQDAQFTGFEPSYTDNGDGTITDNVTGLIWAQELSSYTMEWSEASSYCESVSSGDIADWRLPTVKELWSIRDFSQGWPWVDTNYFHLVGDGSEMGMHHSWTSNAYLVESEYQNEQVVGDPHWIVNDWTGHIKAMSGRRFVRCVSGDEYGINGFVDNGNGTVTDEATGLMWAQDDSGEAIDWEAALAYADSAAIGGYDDWRLPNVKELQSLADYSGVFPAMDSSVFNLTELTNVVYDMSTGDEIATQVTYPGYWTSTSNPVTVEDAAEGGNTYAWLLVAGYNTDTSGYDLHGAGSVVFDTKAEAVSDGTDFEVIYHHARLVRDGAVTATPDGDPTTVDPDRVVVFEDGEMGGGGGGQGGQAPDFAAAAATLGVTEEALMEAMGEPGQQPDFATAAAALGVTVEELEAALMDGSGAPEGGAPAEHVTDSSEMAADSADTSATYTLNETGQGFCYNSDGENIDCPAAGDDFYGQDAQFTGAAFDFIDNGDGTVTDNVTGLTWEQSPASGSSSWTEAQEYCEALSLGGQDDWRMPYVKELFSISNFSAGWPYLDTTYFALTVNDSISKDEQYWANNYYVGKTAEGQYDAAFGVNHATGHIKAYPALVTGPMGKYVRCVYGDEYLINDFVDNGDGTITDNATALTWTQADSGEGMDWEAALAYAQEMNVANYLGYSDWRLPNVKELQSIADYDYAPDALDEAFDGPALDPLFSVSEVTNEAGELDYPYFWTSTSARFQATGDFHYAWYVAAGRAVDASGNDSHGAGAVRFDVKVEGGPGGEGDERVYNYVRLVRGGDVTETPNGDPEANDTALALEFNGGGEPVDGAPQGSGGPGAPQGSGGPGGPQGSGGPGGPQQPDFAVAAATLGISEDALMSALEITNQRPPDFKAAAEALGVSTEELEAALMNSSGVPAAGAPAKGPADSSERPADSTEQSAGDATGAGTYAVVIADADFEATDWTEETHGNDVAPNFEEVFDNTEVKRLDLVVSEENWQLMLDDMTATYGEFGQRSRGRGLLDTAEDPIWAPADVFYNGTQWYQVGLRFKGNSSLTSPWQQGNLKLPFKLDFDEFEDEYPQINNQRFYGFKQLSLKNNFEDESFLREKVAAEVFEAAGLVVSHTAFYELYVDHGDGPEYFGLYTLVEEVDDTVIDTQFASNDGNLYKPEDEGATFVEGTFGEEYFEKKTNDDDDEADWSDILALFDVLHDDTATTDSATWRANLEAVFDVDGFLKYLAVNEIIQNWDTYGRMSHNYYLYNDPETSLLTWIPWDNNEAFQDGKMGGALALDFSNLDSAGWPLISKLYADEVYRAQYDAYLSEVMSDAFETSRIQALYETYADLIKPAATAELPGFTFLEGEDDFANAIDALIDHAASRADAVNAYLGGQ